jgi:hypothetical protein
VRKPLYKILYVPKHKICLEHEGSVWAQAGEDVRRQQKIRWTNLEGPWWQQLAIAPWTEKGLWDHTGLDVIQALPLSVGWPWYTDVSFRVSEASSGKWAYFAYALHTSCQECGGFWNSGVTLSNNL